MYEDIAFEKIGLGNNDRYYLFLGVPLMRSGVDAKV